MIGSFRVENWKHSFMRHPAEDFYKAIESNTKSIGVVVDGVTCDPFKQLPPMTGMIGPVGNFIFSFAYPRPSRVQEVSDLALSRLIHGLNYKDLENMDSIKDIFEDANESIRIKNCYDGIFPETNDYLKNWYAGCVASAFLHDKIERTMYYNYIADCGVAIFRKLDFFWMTEDQGPRKFEKERQEVLKQFGLKWEMPKCRRLIRRDYINHPSQKYSYGVLNGQPEAMHYVSSGKLDTEPGDILLAYTDGVADTLKSGEALDFLRHSNFSGLQKLCQKNVQHEGALVYEHSTDAEKKFLKKAFENLNREHLNVNCNY